MQDDQEARKRAMQLGLKDRGSPFVRIMNTHDIACSPLESLHVFHLGILKYIARTVRDQNAGADSKTTQNMSDNMRNFYKAFRNLPHIGGHKPPLEALGNWTGKDFKYCLHTSVFWLSHIRGTGRGSEKEQSRCRFVRAMAVCFKVALLALQPQTTQSERDQIRALLHDVPIELAFPTRVKAHHITQHLGDALEECGTPFMSNERTEAFNKETRAAIANSNKVQCFKDIQLHHLRQWKLCLLTHGAPIQGKDVCIVKPQPASDPKLRLSFAWTRTQGRRISCLSVDELSSNLNVPGLSEQLAPGSYKLYTRLSWGTRISVRGVQPGESFIRPDPSAIGSASTDLDADAARHQLVLALDGLRPTYLLSFADGRQGLFVAGVQDQASGQRHVLFIPVINVVPVDQVRTLVHRFSGLDSVALQEQERLVVHAMNINDVCRVSVLNHDCNETITCQTSGCQPSLHPAWFVVTPVWDSARGVAA